MTKPYKEWLNKTDWRLDGNFLSLKGKMLNWLIKFFNAIAES